MLFGEALNRIIALIKKHMQSKYDLLGPEHEAKDPELVLIQKVQKTDQDLEALTDVFASMTIGDRSEQVGRITTIFAEHSWDALLALPKDAFQSRVDEVLSKPQDLAEKKMLAMARLKRKLIELKQNHDHRIEQRRQQIAKRDAQGLGGAPGDEHPLDKELIDQASTLIQEALQLCKHFRCSKDWQAGALQWKQGQGSSEPLLNACESILGTFYAHCVQLDLRPRELPPSSPWALIDRVMETDDEFMQIRLKGAKYLLDNLCFYLELQYSSEGGLKSRAQGFFYSPECAERKRKNVVEFIQAVGAKRDEFESDHEFKQSVLRLIDELKRAAGALSGSNSIVSTQKIDCFYEEVKGISSNTKKQKSAFG